MVILAVISDIAGTGSDGIGVCGDGIRGILVLFYTGPICAFEGGDFVGSVCV